MSLQEDINLVTNLILCGCNKRRIASAFVDFVESNYIRKDAFDNLTIEAANLLNNTCDIEFGINDGCLQEITRL